MTGKLILDGNNCSYRPSGAEYDWITSEIDFMFLFSGFSLELHISVVIAPILVRPYLSFFDCILV